MDYNGGAVLPVALSKGTCGAFRLREDGLLRIRSAQFPQETVELPLQELRPGRNSSWSAYVEGAVYFAQEAWGQLSGLELALTADLPIARGLSSSASVEALTIYALARLLDRPVDPDEWVSLAHRAETEYVGVQCGLLDQAAIVYAQPNTALLYDCSTRAREHLPLEGSRAMIAIVDSGIRRELTGSAFNQRVDECRQAFEYFRKHQPGMASLSRLQADTFSEFGGELDATLRRRAEHVLSEAQRTSRAAEALRKLDLASFGRAMFAAHDSLRDLYEVSIPELDVLVDAAREVEACYGARLTGAGFGGCIVAVVHPDGRDAFSEHVPARYRERTGRETQVEWFHPSGGPCELEH